MRNLQLFVAILLLPSVSQAEPSPETPPRIAAPDLPFACPPGSARTSLLCLKLELETDPAYRAAVRRRTAGIALVSTGGVGAVLLVTAAVWSWGKFLDDLTSDGGPANYRAPTVLAIAGGATLAAALVIGLPVLISGVREVRAIRRRHLMPIVSVTGDGAVVGGSLRF